MLIIWGFRRTSVQLAIISLACRNGHVAAHRLLKSTRWFTLFFIPLIPFKRRYVSVCVACGATVQWTKEDALAAAASASPEQGRGAAMRDPVAPPLPSGSAFGAPSPMPAQPVPAGPPAGWFPDPAGGTGQRYWDGTAWTDATLPA